MTDPTPPTDPTPEAAAPEAAPPEVVAPETAAPEVVGSAAAAPAPPAEAAPEAPPPAARPVIDLALPPTYRGLAFTAAEWSWPTAVRAAIYLCDYLAADPARLGLVLLPGRLALDAGGQLTVAPATVAEARPFVAPERRGAGEGAAVETATVYHVAAVLHYLLVDYPPLGNVALIDREAPDTPAALKNVLLRALAIDPAERPDTVAELRAQLYFVLVPPAWYETAVPRLPLDDEQKAGLIDRFDQLQLGWYRLRDQLPHRRMNRARKGTAAAAARPGVGRALTIAGILAVLLIYVILLTDIL